MLYVATSRFSWAKMVLWINILSDITVGAVASSFAICWRWTLPFAQARALTSPVRFSVKNMSEIRALRLSSLVRVAGLQGRKHCKVWNCCSSFITAALPQSVNFWRPVFSPYCFLIDVGRVWLRYLSRSKTWTNPKKNCYSTINLLLVQFYWSIVLFLYVCWNCNTIAVIFIFMFKNNNYSIQFIYSD